MPDIKLYKIDNEIKELKPSAISLEKNLQTIIENNMEIMFGVRFLKSEFQITNGRMDSIGIDENNCPVIFEYKRNANENVINQGLFYLDWLVDHKADFKLLVIEKLGKKRADEIDWSTPCVICIANDFKKYDIHAVNQMQRNIKLVKYKKYDDIILFEHLNTPNFMEPNKVNQKHHRTHYEKYESASKEIKNLYDDIKNYIESLGDDIVKYENKHYIAFKKVKNMICLAIHNKSITLWLSLKFDEIDEEKDFIRNVKDIGHCGTGDIEIKIKNYNNFEKAKKYIDKAYNEN